MTEQPGYSSLLDWWKGPGSIGILVKNLQQVILTWPSASREEVERRLAECPVIASGLMVAQTAEGLPRR